MADEIAVDSFLDLLRQSDLVPEGQLRALMAEAGSGGTRPETAHNLADELVKREVLTVWQAEMLLQGKHRGFRLGPYRILRPLGQGGMSKVFLAEHEVMRRCCAIKVLPAKYEEDADLLNRFHLEARAIAALDHPNIVRAYDFNKDVRYGKQIHYLVMEYVEGPDLRRMIDQQGPLDYRKAADFIGQAAEGLAHAHAAGFVHRDIKPANLLVDPHGVLKVLDLGLARFDFEADQGRSSSAGGQSAVGTADYIAPEQVTDSRNVDGRADIYSLGHTFYFLLTGHRPFSKASIMELLVAHRQEQPEPIGKSRPDVPLELEAIIDKMTAKSPLQRYQTAKEVAEKLRTWLKESESGRGYSRMSALMAEALRAKQFSAEDTAQMKSLATQDTELELASLDDEPARSPGASGTMSASSSQLKTTKATAADAKDKDRPTAGKDAATAGAKQPPANRATGESSHKTLVPNGTQPAGKKDEAALPSLKANLLSAPLAEALATAAPADEPLPAPATGPGPFPDSVRSKLQQKPKENSDSLLTSPLAWVGLGGLLLVSLLSGALIVFAPRSAKNGSDEPPPAQVAADLPATPEQATHAAGRKGGESPNIAPPKANEARPFQQAQAPLRPSAEKAPSPSKPDEAPPQMTPDEAVTWPAPTEERGKQPETTQLSQPEGDEGKPPETAKPLTPKRGDGKRREPKTPPKEEPINKDELFGGITTIWFGLKSFDPANKLHQLVRAKAEAAAEKAGLAVAEKDAALMEIELKEGKAGDLVISAELKCPTPNGKPVTVWQNSKQILSIDRKKVRSASALLKLVREPIGKFFDQFVDDVRQARSKRGPE